MMFSWLRLIFFCTALAADCFATKGQLTLQSAFVLLFTFIAGTHVKKINFCELKVNERANSIGLTIGRKVTDLDKPDFLRIYGELVDWLKYRVFLGYFMCSGCVGELTVQLNPAVHRLFQLHLRIAHGLHDGLLLGVRLLIKAGIADLKLQCSNFFFECSDQSG